MDKTDKQQWEKKLYKLISHYNKYTKEFDLFLDELGFTDHLEGFIQSLIDQARREVINDVADPAIWRMQIIAVEACKRLKDEKGIQIAKDIREKYEQLKEDV